MPNIPLIPIVYPQNRRADGAMNFLVRKFEHVKEELEAICGHEISAADLEAAFAVYERYRAVMRKFVEVIRDFAVSGGGVLMISHEHRLLAAVCDGVVALE